MSVSHKGVGKRGNSYSSGTGESSSPMEKKAGESKDFSDFNSQENVFLMRKDRDMQKLVDMLKMAICSDDEGLQKV